jgi:ankyrin repeat protein
MVYETSIHKADIYGAYPIHYAAQLCGDEHSNKGLEILKKLIEYNADINCRDEQKRTPFIWATTAG